MLSFSCRKAKAAAPPPVAAPPAAAVPMTLGAARGAGAAGFLADVVDVLPDAAVAAGPADTPAAFLRATASYSCPGKF